MEIPKEDFDIIDAIYVPAQSQGKYLLEIGTHFVDKVKPLMCQRGDAKDWKLQLLFFGKQCMNLLSYMYPYQQTKIYYSGNEREDKWQSESVAFEYTVKGKKYTSIEHLIVYENFEYQERDSFFRRVNAMPSVCEKENYLKRQLEVPIVSFGYLNFLYYKDGFCCVRYSFT